MIKFFRQIRQKLLAENKVIKYLLYAVGEIILVVIGILIALQIDNWNEQKKLRKEEQAVILSLHENFVIASEQSTELIAEEDTLMHRLIRILKIDSNNTSLNYEVISDSIFKSAVWDLQSDMPTFNTYKNLKNTNKLSLIKSPEIHKRFASLEFAMNKLDDLLADRLTVHQTRVDNILEDNINFIPLVKSNLPSINIENEPSNNYEEILQSRNVRNLLGMKLTFTQDIINRRSDVDKEIKVIIELLEERLSHISQVTFNDKPSSYSG